MDIIFGAHSYCYFFFLNSYGGGKVLVDYIGTRDEATTKEDDGL